MSAHRTRRNHFGIPAASLIPTRTIGVTELISVMEDVFPTQRIQMPTRDTQPLRGQW